MAWPGVQVVLEKAGAFFDRAKLEVRPEAFDSFSEAQDAPLLEAAVQEKVARIGFVAGTIASEKVMAFERLLFRATRGNMYLRETSVGKVKDPITGDNIDKHVFVIFFAGDRARFKVMKVCDRPHTGMHACMLQGRHAEARRRRRRQSCRACMHTCMHGSLSLVPDRHRGVRSTRQRQGHDRQHGLRVRACTPGPAAVLSQQASTHTPPLLTSHHACHAAACRSARPSVPTATRSPTTPRARARC